MVIPVTAIKHLPCMGNTGLIPRLIILGKITYQHILPRARKGLLTNPLFSVLFIALRDTAAVLFFKVDQIMPERWMSVTEIAEHLGIKKDTVYKWVRTMVCPPTRLASS
jgi:hypothetical protein